MSEQYVVSFEPEQLSIKVRSGTTVLDAAKRARVNVRTRCGGVAGCLMCKVNVASDQAEHLSLPSEAELRKLGPQLDDGIRLSCQARVKGNVTVTVPEDPLKAAIRKKLAEQQEDDFFF
ncbi:MAG: 2Fe-2S iron-sulfur cluster-binding protein [Candidatus Cohnella colombiensis]|uniref:2Fe-2S iron-sulfur cluster-binding protein n=1 Tax=Candidatus Cohnella colombiensis TaxID=3121368 RepID=A0AA95EZB1_9BACL|nr:MAG: 2Fe-2S iron-sulfur cluster-binding protein [Cohnella sp.]